MLRVETISQFSQLATIASQWQALLAETPGASFFQSLPWLEAYWAHYGRHQQLRVMTVWSGDKLAGIVPLVIRKQTRLIGALSILTYPLDDWGSFFSPISAQPAETFTAAMAHLRDQRRDWDLIELPWVDGATDRGQTAAAMAAAGMPVEAELRSTSAVIDLASFDGWHPYWASRTSRWRNNVKRSERKLAEQGAVTYLRYRPGAGGDPRWDLYDLCEQLAASSWQGGSQTGTTLSHDEVRPFLRDAHVAAAAAGALDLNLLAVDGRYVAFNYAYHCHGNVFGLRTGFDANFDGAGTALQARMIADSFQRGDRLYDLGPGYLDCKRYWQTELRQSIRYTYFPPAPRAQLVRVKRQLESLWTEAVSQAESKRAQGAAN